MELSLYQSSIWGLAATSAMIAMFFFVLQRANHRAEMRWWTNGWFANVAAMSLTLVFWYAQPPAAAHSFLFAAYLAARNTYVWLLLRGTLEFQSRRPAMIEARRAVPLIIACSILAIFTVTTRARLDLVSNAIIAAAFFGGAWVLARARVPAAQWIMIALASRALLALVEAGAAVSVMAPAPLAAHYPLNIAAEWLLAMGFLIGVSVRTQQELKLANDQMLSAQSDLRRLADRDPLTSLVNRRALPEVFREVQPAGAMLVFFDLDGFKEINDKHGHQAGDACLVRFATALSASFRPTDAIVRYAGDDFLVVAKGTEIDMEERVTELRNRLRMAPAHDLPIRFSYGISRLEPGGNPDEAVKLADEAMYRSKAHAGARGVMVADRQAW